MELNLLLTIGLAAQVLLSLGICLTARRIGSALGVLDRPDNVRKLHAGAVPLVGGLAILLPFGVVAGASAVTDPVFGAVAPVILAATGLLFIMGMMDDRKHLPPVIRLGVSLVVFTGAVALVPDLMLTGLVLTDDVVIPLWPLVGAGLAAISLVGFQYAFNMSDGANGVAAGTALIWSLFLATGAEGGYLAAALMIAAGCAVFLAFNLRGRIFLGDSGAYGLSAVVGMLGLAVTSAPDARIENILLLSLFLVPVMDCMRLIVVRVRGKRAPFSPDREHLHHYLLDAFRSPVKMVVCYWALIAVPNALAFSLGGVLGAALGVAVTVCVYSLTVVYASRHSRRQKKDRGVVLEVISNDGLLRPATTGGFSVVHSSTLPAGMALAAGKGVHRGPMHPAAHQGGIAVAQAASHGH